MPTGPKGVKLHAEAEAELRESLRFYRERAGDRWAERFKQRVAEALQAITGALSARARPPGSTENPSETVSLRRALHQTA